MKDRKKRDLLIGILGVMLVFVGIGYAVLSSTLTITSISNVAGSWNVQLTSIAKASSTGSAVSNSTSINSDGLGGTVSNTFTAPGESITYDVKVENKGKIDAVINIDLPEDDSYYLFSTTFIDDTSLKSNNEYTFQITITYDEDAIDAPSGTSNHSFTIMAEQDNSSSSKENSYIHLVDDEADIDEIGTEIAIGDEHFYVISSNDNTITMLAKYNLLVGTNFRKITSEDSCVDSGYTWNNSTCSDGDRFAISPSAISYNLQSSSSIGYNDSNSYNGVVPFSYDGYWFTEYYVKNEYSYGTMYDSNSNLFQYVQRYKELLEQNYSVEINDARLLNNSEIYNLGGCYTSAGDLLCDYEMIEENNREWLYSTSYWLDYYLPDCASLVLVFLPVEINSYHHNFDVYSYDDNTHFGVRPVIVINKSEFN